MDGLTFIAQIIESLAWPLAIVIVVLILRSPLSQVILGLKRLKYQDLELDFEKEIAKLERAVEEATEPLEADTKQLPPAPGENVIKVETVDNSIEEVAALSPKSGIILAWNLVEKELQSAIMRLAISADYPPYLSAMRNIELLKEQGLITDLVYDLLNGLRRLRNEVIHDRPAQSTLTVDDAFDYLRIVQRVLPVIKGLDRK
jgi:hypothetical protein